MSHQIVHQERPMWPNKCAQHNAYSVDFYLWQPTAWNTMASIDWKNNTSLWF